VAQYKNLVIAVYSIEKIPALYIPIRHFFTHAWFPKDKFDEIVEKAGWIFARKDDGYLALRSQNPYFWNTRDAKNKGFAFRQNPEDFDRDIIVPGKQNIWLCQLGRKADDGSFGQFLDSICAAELTFSGLNVEYRSPSNGLVRFGWDQAFSVDNVDCQLHDYLRYDNPYVQAGFDPNEIRVIAGERELYFNWKTGERRTT